MGKDDMRMQMAVVGAVYDRASFLLAREKRALIERAYRGRK